MKNVLRILSATFVIGLIAACSDGGGGGSSAQACNNSSECPSGYECIANSTASEQDHQLSPGYTIQGLTCAQFCEQGDGLCGGDGSDLAACEAQCNSQGTLPEGCLECVLSQPGLCTGEPPQACAAICTGSSQGGGGSSSQGGGGSSSNAGGSSSSQGQGGSGTLPGAGGSATSQGQGGSGTLPGAGGSSSGTPAKTGVCRAKSTQGGGGTSSQGGGGSSSGSVNCNSICQKASGCSGFDSAKCAAQCPQVSDACRSCINNAPDICNTVAYSETSTVCLSECTSSSQGGGGTSSQGGGGSSSQGQGGSSSSQGGSGSSSDNTCTLNGTKYNCPSADAAQQCFDNFAPGSCTPA